MSESERPRNHLAITLFRIFLWIFPSALIVAIVLKGGYLPARMGWSNPSAMYFWIVFITALTAGAGWFNAALSNRARVEKRSLLPHTFLFLITQLFLTPLILFSLLFAACVVYPVKIAP